MRAFLFFLFISVSCYVFAGPDSVKVYTTAHSISHVPKIDGDLSDQAWESVSWGGGDFIQNNPEAGAPASVQTLFKILYDEKYLYVAIRNLDPEPAKIVSRMSRRDSFEGDFVEINIDSYFDKRTAFSFTASVSGVKSDEYVSNNGADWDENWDPIWYLETKINEEGWVAEMKIPLSQLRFADKEEHVWGLQVTRRFFRNQERSNWQAIAPDASGWVHRFGELHGIKGIKPQRQLEVQPFLVARAETFEREEGNPFMTGKSTGLMAGLDIKAGITSDITLDVSVNPDFGQVEADPSQLNLTAFRLFFPERRPFFIEGNNTLNFPLTDFSSNNLFYSRRIGRTPQGSGYTDPEDQDDGVSEYVKENANTTILGAAKLTGKNKHGFSWAILESVTDLEKVEIDSLGFRRKVVTEPLTNYFVARAQQDINKGNTIVGGMLTATNRKLDDDSLQWLHKSAYSGGVDFLHQWKERKYYVSVKALMSYVLGSEKSIRFTQEAPERFFQRPDNDHSDVVNNRRSLRGTGGTLLVGKQNGKLVYEAGFNWLSPQLEMNDIGFLSQTDQLTQWTFGEYRILKPFGMFRSTRFTLVQWNGWDFDRKHINDGYETSTVLQFKNFWSFRSQVTLEHRNVSNADLRGGPALHLPGTMSYFFTVGSDDRKKFSFSATRRWQDGFDGFYHHSALDLQFKYRPTNALSLVVAPTLSRSRNNSQYVTTLSDFHQEHYVVARIDQTIALLSMRMTYMITPNLSIQYWGQPFGTGGRYSDYKYVTDADAAKYRQRFTSLPAEVIKQDADDYVIDENLDGATDHTFGKPDFNFGQFKSNMVIRWEYIPGSTIFLVWTQQMNGEFYDREGAFTRRFDFNFEDKAQNIFLLKYTYRLIM